VTVWVSVRHPIVDSLQQHPRPSYLWQALWAGAVGSAQEHLHWMTWFDDLNLLAKHRQGEGSGKR